MRTISAIADSTFKELIRQPIGYLLTGLTALLLFLSRYVIQLSTEDQTKMIQDIGLDSILMCNLMLCVYAATVVVTREIEGKTALTLFSKPVRRWQFIVGKYAGIMGSIAITSFLLGVLLVIVAKTAPVHGHHDHATETATGIRIIELGKGLLLGYFQAGVICAIAMAVATRLSAIPTMLISLFAFILGHLADYIFNGFRNGEGLLPLPVKAFYLIIPNLENFNVNSAIARQQYISGEYVALTLLYGVIYAGVSLFAAAILLEKRELT